MSEQRGVQVTTTGCGCWLLLALLWIAGSIGFVLGVVIA